MPLQAWQESIGWVLLGLSMWCLIPSNAYTTLFTWYMENQNCLSPATANDTIFSGR